MMLIHWLVSMLVVLAITLVGYCAEETPPLINEASYDHTIRLACVGDSITYGMNIAEREKNCYPAQLAVLLGAKWEVKNFGVSGTTMLKKPKYVFCSSYWDQQALKDTLAYQPDVVVLMLGTNDTWTKDNWDLKAQFAVDFRAMLDQFAALPSKPKIWLCTPASAYEARAELEPHMQEACNIIRDIAAERKLVVVDIHSATAHHPDLFPDKCHPNADGAAIIAHEVYQALTGKKAPTTPAAR